MKEHLISKYPVGNALRIHDNWNISCLHICNNRDSANKLEILEIQKYKSLKPGGYNLTIGGEGGSVIGSLKHTDAAKRKIGESSKGRRAGIKRPGHSACMMGNQNAKGGRGHIQLHTDATKEKMRKPHPGICGVNNPSHRIDVKIKKLKRRIDKLKQEITNDNNTR